MPHFAAPDLGLHCLYMLHKKDTRLILVILLNVLISALYEPRKEKHLFVVYDSRMLR